MAIEPSLAVYQDDIMMEDKSPVPCVNARAQAQSIIAGMSQPTLSSLYEQELNASTATEKAAPVCEDNLDEESKCPQTGNEAHSKMDELFSLLPPPLENDSAKRSERR